VTYAFGPGPWTPAVRAIILTNIGVFVASLAAPGLVLNWMGLLPAAIFEEARIWAPATYLFVHSPRSLGHILFNMLAVWMFGTELEKRWGTRAFTTYYLVTGVGAGLCTVAVSLLPFEATAPIYYNVTVGASGAVYGLLLAWAMLFPHREILFMFIFPLKARWFVVLVGAIAFFSALGSGGGSVAHLTHLSGLLIGWVYLKGPRNLRLDLNYHLTRWRMERMRRRFDVHRGGRDNWRDRIH
jgi:membrane associated rhomboid family serine protease